jgi:hypothetical protein
MVPVALQVGKLTAVLGEVVKVQLLTVTTPTYPVVLAEPLMVEVAVAPGETDEGEAVAAVRL